MILERKGEQGESRGGVERVALIKSLIYTRKKERA